MQVLTSDNYTQQKKKCASKIFALHSPLNVKMLICHKILIFDQILLKLYCGIDEYLCLSCAGAKNINVISEAFIHFLSLSTWNLEYALQLHAKYENDIFLVCKTSNAFIHS